MGYTVVAYPLTLLSASTKVMMESLQCIKDGKSTDNLVLPFIELQNVVGFPDYNKEADRYKDPQLK